MGAKTQKSSGLEIMRCNKCLNFFEPDGTCSCCQFLEEKTAIRYPLRCKKCFDMIDPEDYKETGFYGNLCGICQNIKHIQMRIDAENELMNNHYKENGDGEGKGAT